ncbi:hypothetical protein BDN67DRAFT_625930 [Paxillus ammoniavirescens]|nr:hypothetical protein BDN67DRAFT_625930 [Paxillus ammoniavirescens]
MALASSCSCHSKMPLVLPGYLACIYSTRTASMTPGRTPAILNLICRLELRYDVACGVCHRFGAQRQPWTMTPKRPRCSPSPTTSKTLSSLSTYLPVREGTRKCIIFSRLNVLMI